VDAHGRSAHSGSAPHKGRSALLALAAAAQAVAACGDPDGPDRLTAVPTILNSGDAFNVVPARGELLCDLRADRIEAFDPVLAAVPREHDDVRLEPTLVRAWPGMDSRDATRETIAAASEALGRPIAASERGGASDASHMAAGGIALTIDGLGPRGGGAHAPHEWVSAESIRTRAEVALAVTSALLAG
jgi:glutamate carboxypeptidase